VRGRTRERGIDRQCLPNIFARAKEQAMFHHVILASTDGDTVITVFCLILAVAAVYRAVHKAREEKDLRERSPEAYIRLKEIENDEKRRKHEKTLAGMKVGWSIVGWLFKR
jgi:hypothetical protein